MILSILFVYFLDKKYQNYFFEVSLDYYFTIDWRRLPLNLPTPAATNDNECFKTGKEQFHAEHEPIQ